MATTHALFWNKIRPVFVDIELDYYTLDPDKVEAAITPWTIAILAVHVYGYPCKVNALADIARRHNLKLIYDAAHARLCKHRANWPIAHFGDLSMFSFHATKLFHTLEGGLLILRNLLKETFDYLKNFGFKNELGVKAGARHKRQDERKCRPLAGIQMFKYLEEMIEERARLLNCIGNYLKTRPVFTSRRLCLPDIRCGSYGIHDSRSGIKEFGMQSGQVV